MKNKACFYLMGEKGFSVFNDFLDRFGAACIAYVVSSRDQALAKDYYDEIHSACIDAGVQFFNKKEFVDIDSHGKSVKFAIGWRWIIHDSSDLIVLHDSLLPKYRGFAPLVNMLTNGENKIGVTALLASAEYDKGDIIKQIAMDICYPIKISAAIKNISTLYSTLVLDIFNDILLGKTLCPVVQSDSDATYSLWLNEDDYFINWSWSAAKISRFVDAVGFPYGRARATANTTIVMIDDAVEVEDVYVEDRERHIGKIIFMKDSKPVVICGQGLLQLLAIELIESNSSQINFRTRFK